MLGTYKSIVIISGPSGVGKTTLARRINSEYGTLCISATTRPPRHDEVDGRDYRFFSSDEFERKVRAGEFIEHTSVHGNRYGTLNTDLEAIWSRGKVAILVIDVQGFRTWKDHPDPDMQLSTTSIFITVPHPQLKNLEARIRKNRPEATDEDIARRLKTAEQELAYVEEYDRVIVNDNLEQAVRALNTIVECEIVSFP